jgi:type IV secretory pathway TraG/TraD family ATPase VirD4
MLSDMTGTRTVMKHSRSFTGKRSKWMMSNMSESLSETQRPLLTSDEIMRLPADKALVFVAGHNAALCSRIKYYEDKAFTQRSNFAAPTSSDTFAYSITSLGLPEWKGGVTISAPTQSDASHSDGQDAMEALPPMQAPSLKVVTSLTESPKQKNPFTA